MMLSLYHDSEDDEYTQGAMDVIAFSWSPDAQKLLVTYGYLSKEERPRFVCLWDIITLTAEVCYP